MSEIVVCKVHPGIGIARLGNSPEGFFIGPEAPGRPVVPRGGFKDAQGRVKRQAARFRIYGYDAAGVVVREVTAKEAVITWTVHLANAKGAWKKFVGRFHETAEHRNPQVPSPRFPSRDALVVDPGPRSVAGRGVSANGPQFEGGHFLGESVALGQLRTDDVGRLLVLGGFGRSGSVLPDNPIRDYANNDGWFDDTSDGPVTATVALKRGGPVPVTGGWVLVAPPDFSPHTENLVTLYDVMAELFLPAPERVSFTEHVYPILRRAAGYRWVSARAFGGHGPGLGGDFLDPVRIGALADSSDAARGDREAVFRRIRAPGASDPSQARSRFMPMLSGDDGDATPGQPRTWLAVVPSQYRALERWAAGDFVADWTGSPSPPAFEEIPDQDQPSSLDRAALEACTGGPFYPGIEMTYVATDRALYAEPFRLRADLGPGDVTGPMALPWQADFYDCQGHWWPAQRPDEVVGEAQFDEAARRMAADDPPGTLASGLGAPRDGWARGVDGKDSMVDDWSRLGFVTQRQTRNREVALVETERDPEL
jgi:hypothetical protein